MDIDDLIQQVISYAGSSETEGTLTTAFQIAEEVHRGYRRISDTPFINHPLSVATILAGWHAPLPVVATGLLHDIHSIDYSHGYDMEDIQSKLGPDIYRLLKEAVNLNKFVRQIERNFDAEVEVVNIRHYMMSVLHQEPDAVVVKLADRLHNLQTITALSRYFQERTARIGFNLLAPLADLLGMGMVKRSLEDYSFEILNPAQYQQIKQRYANTDVHPDVQSVRAELSRALTDQGLQQEIRWQPASLYALYRHQVEQNTRSGKSSRMEPTPLKIVDAGAFIVLTEEEADCYRALGLVHKLYQPVKGQLIDLIAHNKENGYRSLLTQVKHSSGNVLRINIRTRDMDVIAERGITARWWNVPEALLPQLSQKNNPLDGEIQVFTPTGEIKYLSQGATVLDFAYSVHTEVGHGCAGALVNGVQVDAYSPLESGDRIEIIAGGPNHHPTLDWLRHVRTSQASSAIKQWLMQHQHNAMLARGRNLLNQQLQPLGLNATDPQVCELLNHSAAKEGMEGQEDLLAAIGVGRLDAHKLVEQFKSMRLGAAHPPNDLTASLSVHVMSSEEALLIQTFARCCRPMPFDEIVAYRSDGKLMVHKRTCAQIKELEKPTQVEWDTGPLEPHYVAVVEALNRPGLAHDLTTVISQLDLDMSSFSASKRPDGVMAESHIYLGKTTPMQRDRVQKALEAVPYVTNVEVIHSSLFMSYTQQPLSSSTYRANPYGTGVAKGTRFYGRDLECERITSYLCDQTQNHAILVWGQKRIGKTSLVVRLQEEARGRFLPVYIDMQAMKDGTNTQFLHQLMSRIALALREHDASLEVSAPALNHLRKDPLGYFDTFLFHVQQTQIVGNCPLVIILDEFQCLCNLREATISRNAIFSRLRSQTLHGQGAHIVLSGGGLLSHLLAQTGIDALLNITHDEKLTTLETDAAHRLIKEGLMQVGGIVDIAIDYLLQITAGHPYYLQLLCSHLYEQAQEQRTKITHHFASSCVHDWIEKADKSRFQHLWEGHDDSSARRNKLILSALAEPGLRGMNDEVEYEKLIGAIGHLVPESELVRALEDLAYLGILKQDHARYTITVKLFTLWLRHQWPLTLTMKEGDWV